MDSKEIEECLEAYSPYINPLSADDSYMSPPYSPLTYTNPLDRRHSLSYPMNNHADFKRRPSFLALATIQDDFSLPELDLTSFQMDPFSGQSMMSPMMSPMLSPMLSQPLSINTLSINTDFTMMNSPMNYTPYTSTPSTPWEIKTEGESYQCSLCPRKFARKYNCMSHEKTHESNRQKKHECVSCKQMFYRTADLKRHEKTHQDKEFYSLCGKRFSRLDAVERHKSKTNCAVCCRTNSFL